MARFSKNRLFSRLIKQFNEDLTIKTEGLSTEVQTSVTSALDSAEVVNLITANSSSGVTATTLTKTFTQNEEYQLTLTDSIAVSPIVSATKEVAPSDVSSKGNWDVASNGANYDLHNSAYDTTLAKGTTEIADTAYDLGTISYDNISVNLSEIFAVGDQPLGLTFKPDGTKLFIPVAQGKVYQYSLTSAWDITTLSHDGTYTFTEIATAQTVIFNDNGTKSYILNYDDDSIYQYSLSIAYDLSSAIYDSISLNVSSQEAQPNNIVFGKNGTKLYLIGFNDQVEEFDLTSAYDLSSASWLQNFSVVSETGVGSEVKFNADGTKMYVGDYSNGNMYEYTLSSAWDVTSATYSSINTGALNGNRGHVFNSIGTKMYVVAQSVSGRPIYQYSTGTSSNVNTLNLGSGSFSSADVGKRIIAGGGEATIISSVGEYSETTTIPDVTYTSGQWQMYGLDVNAANGITVSSTPIISNPYDLTGNSGTKVAVTLQDIVDAVGGHVDLGDVVVTQDGTKLYLAGFNRFLYQYTMSTPYDISTAVYSTAHDFTSVSSNGFGTLNFGNNDQYIYFGDNSGNVHQYSLSTPGDVTTATFMQTKTGVAFRSFRISDDGTRAYGNYWPEEDIYEYVFGTAWDISTLTSNGVVHTTTKTNPRAIEFSEDGKLFILTDQNNSTVQYSLSTGFDFSTIDTVNTLNTTFVSGAFYWTNNGGTLFGIPFLTGVNATTFSMSSIQGGSIENLLYSNYSSAITNNSGQIGTTSWADINSMTADQSLSGTGKIYYAVSADARSTFNVINGTLGERTIAKDSDGTWVYNTNTTYSLETWTTASSNDPYTALNEAIDNVAANKMDATQLAGAGDDYHIVLGDTLDLAIIMKSDGTNNLTSDGVSINYTGALYEAGAKFDSDYTYTHDDDKHITITALVAGNYKFRVI